jgi:hypothetical protein
MIFLKTITFIRFPKLAGMKNVHVVQEENIKNVTYNNTPFNATRHLS